MTEIYKTTPIETGEEVAIVDFDNADWIRIKQEFDRVAMTPEEVIELAGALISHLLEGRYSDHYPAIAALYRQLSQAIEIGPAGVYGVFADDLLYTMAGVKVGLPDLDPIK